MRHAILAVNVQYDHYSPKGALGYPGSPVATIHIADLLRQPGNPLIIAARKMRTQEDLSFLAHGGKYKPHCLKGTKGANLLPELTHADYITTTAGLSAFEGGTLRPLKTLEEILKEQKQTIASITVCGYYLEDDVAQTAFDSNALGYTTYVYLPACQTYTGAPSPATVERLERAGVVVR